MKEKPFTKRDERDTLGRRGYPGAKKAMQGRDVRQDPPQPFDRDRLL